MSVYEKNNLRRMQVKRRFSPANDNRPPAAIILRNFLLIGLVSALVASLVWMVWDHSEAENMHIAPSDDPFLSDSVAPPLADF